MTDAQQDGEAFIPCLRHDLVSLCLDDGKLTPDQREEFAELCDLLATCLHLEFHRDFEAVDRHYAHFDPDRDTLRLGASSSRQHHEEQVVECFHRLAKRANYFEISKELLRECLDAYTLIDLRTEVSLDDFDRILCFARGDILSETTVRKLWKEEQREIDVYQRVVLLIKFKPAEYFERTGRKKHSEFKPGRIYAFFYKDVPKYDLEFLFPNVEVGMTLKDKIMLGVPAVGGSFVVLSKILPQLLIVIGVILFFVAGPEAARRFEVDDETVSNFIPVLTAALGLALALGGFAFKQWDAYRKKRLQFLKHVSEQLLYRHLATNQAVFHRLIASAEAEEAKEMILVLYHLWTGPEEGQTAEELDLRIEAWLESHLDTGVNFDIDGPIENLQRMTGRPPGRGELRLLDRPGGKLRPLPLGDAVELLRHLAAERAVQRSQSSETAPA